MDFGDRLEAAMQLCRRRGGLMGKCFVDRDGRLQPADGIKALAADLSSGERMLVAVLLESWGRYTGDLADAATLWPGAPAVADLFETLDLEDGEILVRLLT